MDYILPPAPLINGLCVPMVTALDSTGKFDASSQEKLTAFLARGEAGAGAQALFTDGTSGEWHRCGLEIQRKATETVHYALSGGRGPSLWAGVSADSAGAVLGNIEYAIKIGANAVVLAPLAVQD